MADSTLCSRADDLVDYLYGEASPDDHASFESHVRACALCARELAALGRVRKTLADWEPPAMGLGFRLGVPETVVAFRPGPFRRAAPYLGLAAAAVLVLAAGAAVANVEFRYGPDGLTVRTGWARPAEPNAARVQDAAARPVPASVPATPAAADWQREIAALERRLREEMASHAAPVSAGGGAGASSVEARVLARVRTLIEDSERRQERAQALRFVSFTRDMQAQRQADLNRVQQGLGHLEGVTSAEIVRQRDWMNYIMRVSTRPEKPQN